MRIDVVSIFPSYLAPLQLSLVGKAIETGLVELGVHDLRDWSSDRNRRVDDTPYGGGAGMVMKPEPWGQALDSLATPESRLVILSPSGRPFDQALAEELARESHLILGCGRYEGIDARVVEYARTRMPVEEVSIGDYVLNGGEAAALVLVEAVVRLLPGVVGNPASLAEESHAASHHHLLEYPAYTKPPNWRGLAVPPVLLSGHHGQVAAWRREQALALTRARRPELLPPEFAPLTVTRATPELAGEVWTLQRAAFLSEAQLHDCYTIPPLIEGADDIRATIDRGVVLVARRAGRLVGAVSAELEGEFWSIGRLMVAPDLQGQVIGSRLLTEIETAGPAEASRYRLVTGVRSEANLRFYRRRAYQEVGRTTLPGAPELIVLEKPTGAATERVQKHQ